MFIQKEDRTGTFTRQKSTSASQEETTAEKIRRQKLNMSSPPDKMFSPTGRVTVFRPKLLQPKKLPKPLVAVFVLAQLFSGINFGFFAAVSSKRLRTLANILSALIGLLVVTSYLIYSYFRWDPIAPVFAAQYFIVFIATRFSKYTIFNFLTDLTAIDDKFNIKLNSRFGLTTSICVLFACCYRVVMSSSYCVYIGCFKNGNSLILFVFYDMRHVISIILAAVYAIVYYVIYLRIKYIKSAFAQGALETKKVALSFKALSDCFEKISFSRDALIVACFMTDFVKSVRFFWIALTLLKQNTFLGFFVMALDITLLLLLICLPPVIAEMISTQTDEMVLLLQDWLLSGSNGFDEDLPRLLRYVEARPLVHAAWRLVPVDLRLPVSLLSMTATYLVVLVQLTHLY